MCRCCCLGWDDSLLAGAVNTHGVRGPAEAGAGECRESRGPEENIYSVTITFM